MKIVHTKDTMSDIYLDAVKIRRQVFMLEQGVPGEIEIDKYEAACIHFVLYGDKNEAIATCRLLPLQDDLIKLQRMAVQKAFRGNEFGRLIVEGAEEFAKEQGYNMITLGAQITAIGFYEKMGYSKEGEMFLDAAIKHYQMTKNI
ncbi:GNAT family N-acetyltransferase [Enterococcus caccae]|uniref:Acetyltransferase n=1 Tax=Enterococcus caccae ATCC BAA-1240 TaxID=1158612 RepID=R3TPH6_9ENTE|nr:GNAT family N-acetyltransferase [Enterococcus caccae]EOL42953.1 acetyltransferase [Enterococcus caccae ATCC BAA-1240]EOT67766.1 acetyltransferase [Enterococcus caccae ATCC BAA-1240]OJG28745.1 acetyltransferase [Enterococcus caccae]